MALMVGELFAKLKLDETSFSAGLMKAKAEMKQCEAEAASLRASLLKAVPDSDEAKKLEAELSAVEKRLRLLNQVAKDEGGIKSLGKTLTKTLTPALASLAGLFFAAAVKTGAYATDVQNLAKQTGIGTDKLQEYFYICQRVGVAQYTASDAAVRLQKKLAGGDGAKAARGAMEQLGVSVTDSQGHFRKMGDLLPDVIGKLQDVKDEALRNALAAAIFGEQYAEMIPILSLTTAELKAMADEARRSGRVLSGPALNAASAFDDAITKLKLSLGGFLQTAVAGFLALPTAVQGSVVALLGFGLMVGPLMQVADAIKAVRNSTIGANIAAKAGSFGFKSLWKAILGPVGLVIAAIALVVGGVVLLWRNCQWFRDGVRGIWASILGGWKSLMKVLAPVGKALVGMFKGLWKALKDLWAIIKPLLAGLWNALKPVLALLWAVLKPVLAILGGAVGLVLIGALVTLAGVLMGVVKGLTIFIQVWTTVFRGIAWVTKAVFGPVVDWLEKKIDKIAGFFKWLYDKVVGHSYIPDMVVGVGQHIGRLGRVMVQPVMRATGQVARAFRNLNGMVQIDTGSRTPGRRSPLAQVTPPRIGAGVPITQMTPMSGIDPAVLAMFTGGGPRPLTNIVSGIQYPEKEKSKGILPKVQKALEKAAAGASAAVKGTVDKVAKQAATPQRKVKAGQADWMGDGNYGYTYSPEIVEDMLGTLVFIQKQMLAIETARQRKPVYEY